MSTTVKVVELRDADSFEGLSALGVDTLNNESVEVPLGFMKEAADASNDAAANPPKIVDNYWHTYNVATKTYTNTGVYCRGEAFSIKKIYPSIAAMEADFSGNDVKTGEIVLINTNDVENPDNAKIYAKSAKAWVFLVDMSGAIGFTGKTPQLSIGTVTKAPDAAATITLDGVDDAGNPRLKLNIALPKGDKGDKGDTGEQGIQGIQGEVGPVGPQGIQGVIGPKGDKGDKGDTGTMPRIYLDEAYDAIMQNVTWFTHTLGRDFLHFVTFEREFTATYDPEQDNVVGYTFRKENALISLLAYTWGVIQFTENGIIKSYPIEPGSPYCTRNVWVEPYNYGGRLVVQVKLDPSLLNR